MQKKYRLRDRADFFRVYHCGRSFANHQLVLYVLFHPQVSKFRVGVSASKKIGNAVMRNRMRRMIKENIRLQSDCIVDHVDLIFIVRKGAAMMNYEQLSKSINHVLRKAAVLKQRMRQVVRD